MSSLRPDPTESYTVGPGSMKLEEPQWSSPHGLERSKSQAGVPSPPVSQVTAPHDADRYTPTRADVPIDGAGGVTDDDSREVL